MGIAMQIKIKLFQCSLWDYACPLPLLLWIGVVAFGFGFGAVESAAVAGAVSISSSSSSSPSSINDGHGNKGSRSYTPSIAELSVPFRENPKIILGNFPGNSVVLPLLNGEVSASNYLVHLARQAGNSDPGYFIVEAPKNYGVMAVIQQLHLRRISDTKSLLQLVNNCKDYILFEGHNGEKTIPICGTLEKGDNSFYPQNLHGPKFFNSPNGRIKVTFRNHYSYGNDLVSPSESEEQQNQEMLMVEIAFTAYSNCTTEPDSKAKEKFQCTLEKCIDSQLVCDKTVNCAPGENQSHFGVDETNCTRNIVPGGVKIPTPTLSEVLNRGGGENPNHNHNHPGSSIHNHHPIHPSRNIHNPKESQSHGRLQIHGYGQGHGHGQSRFAVENGEEDLDLSSIFLDDELLPVGKPNIVKSKSKSAISSSTMDNNDNISDETPSDDDNSRLPNLTTIIILVIILAFITICGYFWSWVSQFLCAARSLLRSAEVGVQQQVEDHPQGTTGSQQQIFTTTLPHPHAPPRLPIAYYVPAMVLRTASRRQNNINTVQAVSLNSSGNHHDCEKKLDEPDSPPPSYELLFPQPLPGSVATTTPAPTLTTTVIKE